jgi:hypothetical protein
VARPTEVRGSADDTEHAVEKRANRLIVEGLEKD